MTTLDSLAGTATSAVPAGIARSWLLHPATALAWGVGAVAPDVLVLDLEDAVAEREKADARNAVVTELRTRRAWVRINDTTSPHWREDLDRLRGLPGLSGIVLAKAETADDVQRTVELLAPGIPVVPMVESARALQAVERIASHPGTFRIAFGVGDFLRDTGISADPIALAAVRTRLVVASVAAGIPAPIDGPAGGGRSAIQAGLANSKAMGMTGALVLDASSIAEVNEAFCPSIDELDWARGVVLRADEGSRDGSYAPALARARKILTLNEQLGG